MQDVAFSFICQAKPCSFAKWFAFLRKIIEHSMLDEAEKFLGCWLATQCANNLSFTCSFNYEQISLAVHKPSRKVHRILTRLRTMGFLIADIPIYYGELSIEMVQTVRTFKLVFPGVAFQEEGIRLPYMRGRPKITLNLI
ncbi:MAG: hypothetical protein JSS07_10435 [Proteobacteria bacterium]|nr:hypothetical protein [Pseudomonadota bacterium]